MSTIGDDLLRQSGELRADGTPSGRGSRRSSSTTATRSRSRRDSTQGRARLRARGPVHGRARALHDRHRRPRRLRAAGDDAARAPRRPHQLRPHLRADQRAGDRAARRGAGRTPQIFRELAARMGFDEPCFARRRRGAGADRVPAGGARRRRLRRRCARTAGSSSPIADAPFADGGFPTPNGKCRIDAPGLGVPDHVAELRIGGEHARARARAFRWR